MTDLTIEALLAREEIGDVIKRLARGTDRLDAELISSCYHPDGFDDHNAFRGPPEAFAAWVCEVLPHFESTMHLVASPHVRHLDLAAGQAQVDTYCVAHHISRPDESRRQTDMVLGLRYVDRFERRSGPWLIARRVCAFDWSYTIPFDTAARFTFDDDFTVGRRDRTDITYGEI